MPKRTHLTLRITQAEASKIEAEAAGAGVSVSAWVRQAVLERQLAAGLRAEIQALAAERDAKLEASLKTIEAALANQVNRGYFIKVNQHLSKQLAAIMVHHKIAMPKDKDGES